jgi:hypothetical protein
VISTDAVSETPRPPPRSGTVFLILLGLYLLGKLGSVPLLLDTVPTSRWLPIVPLGILLSVLVIAAGQYLSARTGLGLPYVEGWLSGKPPWERLPRVLSLSVIIAVLASLAALGLSLLAWRLNLGVEGVRPRIDELAASYSASWKYLLASVDAGISEEIFYR